MPLQTRFYSYEPSRPPDAVGVYELAWGDNAIVYIGASGSVRRRIQSHARDQEKHFHSYRVIITNDRRRAKQIERREQRRFLNRHGRLPIYNSRIG